MACSAGGLQYSRTTAISSLAPNFVKRLPLCLYHLLQLIETRLGEHNPGKETLRRLMKRSAVAMILQVREGELHILMIKRAEREGDPWSGHMAFPGGRMEKSDAMVMP